MAEEIQGLSKLKVVPASEILGKILRAEPVEYSDIIVDEDLDISMLGLSKEKDKSIISSPIKLYDSLIKGKIIANNSLFRESICQRL
jgi:hypothetical protein